MSISEGFVDLAIAAGSFQAGVGTSAIVRLTGTLAIFISGAALPPQVAATFHQLNSVVIAAKSAGATGATVSTSEGDLGSGAITGLAASAPAVVATAGGKSHSKLEEITRTTSAR